MSSPPPPPLFTLRGHNCAVTSLTSYFVNEDEIRIVSGDEEGTLIEWSCNSLRQVNNNNSICAGTRVQSLKVILGNKTLFVHSRQLGIKLINLISFELEAQFQACDSVFTKSDAIDYSTDQQLAILAFPSYQSQYLVEVRLLDQQLSTVKAGNSPNRKVTIFDVCLKQSPTTQDVSLFVAYEDGILCIYKYCNLEDVTHLTFVPLRTLDLGVKDFLSSFDVHITSDNSIKRIALGFPSSDLFVDTNDNALKLSLGKSKGVSAIRIRHDGRLMAVASWDSKVKILSTKGKFLADLKYHSMKVNDILFIDANNKNVSMISAKCINYLMLCASQDGTISVSSLY